MSDPFIAEVRIFAGNFAPRGWAFCDGQLLPIAQNTALFSLIGTTYGGDGRTTAALPNLQGRAPMHPGRGPGLTDRRLGERVGIETVTLTEAQIPNHSHTLVAFSDATASSPSTSVGLGAAPMYGAGTQVAMDSDIVGATGGNQAHNNMQPYLGINFIIALQGLYPSRS
ncbi:tail fiber protein [Aliiglaciecola sp. CAU 1673]|uniref:phage tail protein n=1 Tax=Aliiglaciecola sp. CAU 1673 TaxID=3032595 RepID=UPI0023DB828B|nr:tail fiber protein [Aliiglaciecola sp. CAU 1673]MDF2178068.1 tail fiber protein [Aliiglaciecola sp. CAU 1673]